MDVEVRLLQGLYLSGKKKAPVGLPKAPEGSHAKQAQKRKKAYPVGLVSGLRINGVI